MKIPILKNSVFCSSFSQFEDLRIKAKDFNCKTMNFHIHFFFTSSLFAAITHEHFASGAALRKRAGRIRNSNGLLTASTFWNDALNNPSQAILELEEEKEKIDAAIEEEKDMIEIMQTMAEFDDAFSMDIVYPLRGIVNEVTTCGPQFRRRGDCFRTRIWRLIRIEVSGHYRHL